MIAAKICGLQTHEAVAAAVTGGAAAIGFVFFPPSPRHVTAEQAGGLAVRVPGHVGRVGVFVDADDALIARAVEAAGLTAIQLHGTEPPARAAELKARHGIEVWRALGVRTRADLATAGAWRGAADRLLIDAKPPAGSELPGGNGLRFDWRILEGTSLPLPWLLSGGLDALNVAEAVRVTAAASVDVSSGVEDAPGSKSPAKITEFLDACRSL